MANPPSAPAVASTLPAAPRACIGPRNEVCQGPRRGLPPDHPVGVDLQDSSRSGTTPWRSPVDGLVGLRRPGLRLLRTGLRRRRSRVGSTEDLVPVLQSAFE